MQTRVDKYKMDETFSPPKRSSKNTELYEEIKNSELDNFSIGSNAKVIAENNSQIDIDKIKEILEKNYQEPPKRSMKFDFPEETTEIIEPEEPKEYDINAVLDQAREEKEVDYQKERLKKIRDTQYDILKNLELEAKTKEQKNNKSKEELLELINTININESQNKNGKKLKEILSEEETTEEMDPLDILTELKGEEETIVAGAKEFTEEMEKFEVDSLELKIKNKKQEQTMENEDDDEDDDTTRTEIQDALDETLDESFYTDSATFNPKDFADLESEEKSGIIVKILIVIVILAIIAGVVLFLNEFLNLGWF